MADQPENLHKSGMTKRALAAAAALLVQACASTPPAEPQPQNIPAAPQPSVQPQAANPKPAPTPPAPPPAGSAVLDTAKLQPFEGERRDVAEPLRGVRKVDRTAQADDLWQRVRQGFAMPDLANDLRSEEHTSELQSHSFISYAVFCLK